MQSYQNMSDEELIAALRSGEKEITDYLMDKYKSLVKKYDFELVEKGIIGGETDDLIQEGMIGLFKAVRDYQPDKDSSFFHFADLCIARQMYTAVEASNRKKHAPLNSYVPLYADSEDSEGRNLADVLETIDEANPENLFISQEDREDFKRKVNETLSKMEQEVLSYYLQGFRYEQIAEAMGKEPKAVDNALQRLKKKLKGK